MGNRNYDENERERTEEYPLPKPDYRFNQQLPPVLDRDGKFRRLIRRRVTNRKPEGRV